MLGTDQSAEGVSFFTSQSITDKDPPLTLSSDANLLASAGWTGQRRYDPELSLSLSLSLSLNLSLSLSLSLYVSLSLSNKRQIALFLFPPAMHLSLRWVRPGWGQSSAYSVNTHKLWLCRVQEY